MLGSVTAACAWASRLADRKWLTSQVSHWHTKPHALWSWLESSVSYIRPRGVSEETVGKYRRFWSPEVTREDQCFCYVPGNNNPERLCRIKSQDKVRARFWVFWLVVWVPYSLCLLLSQDLEAAPRMPWKWKPKEIWGNRVTVGVPRAHFSLYRMNDWGPGQTQFRFPHIEVLFYSPEVSARK